MRKLLHTDPDSTDNARAAEAETFLSEHPELQYVSTCIDLLRKANVDWFTSGQLRDAFPANVRMKWFVDRPDIRQRITTELTGLKAGAARKRSTERQAMDIDDAIGVDCTVQEFDAAFQPDELAVYGDAGAIFKLLLERFPWETNDPLLRELVAMLLDALLEPRGDKPQIMSHLQMRSALPEEHVQERIPLRVRVAVNRARLEHEAEHPSKPFTAEMELAIMTPVTIAAHLDLLEVYHVFKRAGELMAFIPVAADEDGTVNMLETEHPATRPTPLVPPDDLEAHRMERPTHLPALPEEDAVVEAEAIDEADVAEEMSQKPGIKLSLSELEESKSDSGARPRSSLLELANGVFIPRLKEKGVEIKNPKTCKNEDLAALAELVDDGKWPLQPKARISMMTCFIKDQAAERLNGHSLTEQQLIGPFLELLPEDVRTRVAKTLASTLSATKRAAE